ncbi:DUF397 domain-containing protein [Streptomyces sp. NBC_01092]|uniref:DUF397 domain-containing protein n=1 Tax=Streptomyces sp. NBC_01092 TaxID=2903748 RepID=UPI00386D0D26|nr:DUF397 domain-containing protein [Streptomyces sp. NBC_01092]
MIPPSSTPWHRSSYSNGMGGECLEMASFAGTIAVRDSKVPSGPHLTISSPTWENFIGVISQTSQPR